MKLTLKNSQRYNKWVLIITIIGVFSGLGLVAAFLNFPLFLPFLRVEFSNIFVIFPFFVFSLNLALGISLMIGFGKNLLYMAANFSAGGIQGHIFQIIMTFSLTLLIFLFLKMNLLNFDKKTPFLSLNNIKNISSLLIIVSILTIFALLLNRIVFLSWYNGGLFSTIWPFILAFNLVFYSIISFSIYLMNIVNWHKLVRITL